MTTTRVVSFHYTLTNRAGDLLDSSQGEAPMTYLEGSGQIIPGLESALKELGVGEKKKVEVPATQAYGTYNEDLVLDVSRSQFPEENDIQIGMQFQATTPEGQATLFTITNIEGDRVSVDGNHPLAGEDLFFDVEVTEIRPATLEEIQHGHAHGPGGHHHH